VTLTSTYRPDRDQLFTLIRARGETVTSFAHRLGRHPETFWRLKGGKPISRAFAIQIAGALGTEISDFTLPDEPEQQDPQEEPRQVAGVA